ncbi:MAG: hypothetical protein JWM36_3386 [Hyphomicrobiales bacterium]|nr:hypothetical protein [Hyphomicrobiales bacterium]
MQTNIKVYNDWPKLDVGQGTDVGIAQMVAKELDIPADRVFIVQGDGCAHQHGRRYRSSGIAIGAMQCATPRPKPGASSSVWPPMR